MLKFNKIYFLLALLIFAIEAMIALFVHDRIIRPYIGDVLVVVLIYCFAKSFFKLPVLPTAVGVLVFSFGIETLQYFNIVEILGLAHSGLARTVIGTSFAWTDLLCYCCGIGLVLFAEKAATDARVFRANP
jgi:hypothetical protein